MEPHAYRRPARGGQSCEVCGQLPGASVHILAFAGMEAADREAEEARQQAEAAELTARLLEPMGSIDAKAGEMERNAPLFFGTGDNPALF